MPRSDEANQLIRDERRTQILAMALKIFARKGLSDTRIADIAAATGMSQGLIYRYFASKEEVFGVLVEQNFELTLEVIGQAQALPGSAWNKLLWLTHRLLLYQYDYPEGALVVLHALINEGVPTTIRQAARDYVNAVQVPIKALIVAGQAGGQLVQRDPDQLTILYLSTLQGLAATASFLDSARGFPDAKTVLGFLRP